jgi:hypothetical protein
VTTAESQAPQDPGAPGEVVSTTARDAAAAGAQGDPQPIERLTGGPRSFGHIRVFAAGVGLAAVLACGYYLLLDRIRGPVSDAIDKDPRNAGITMRASYCSLPSTSCLELDLTSAVGAAPADVFRAFFQSAEALYLRDRSFEQVVLARNGRTVFLVEGSDFKDIGHQFTIGQTPLNMIRSLPEKLRTPSGRSAYPGWTGGWLGVMKAQLEDANSAARTWIDGY